jgi:hypothetical protein
MGRSLVRRFHGRVVHSRVAIAATLEAFEMNRCAIIALCAAAVPAAAQQSVSIDLAGLQFRNATNQTRSSAPATISPAFRYSYAITGNVRGVNGALGLLYPNPTPIATVLEALAAGSSANLTGQFDNCSGTHPIAPTPQTTSGTSVVSGITVTYAFTLSSSIDAANVASFSVTNVTLSPSILIGYLQFTEGTSVITRLNYCAANCDASTVSPVLTANDFSCFLNKFANADSTANCDCSTATPALTANDFSCFLNKYAAGCS